MNAVPKPEEASASLAQIARHQGQVIKASLVPTWYWWAVAAGMVAIGVVADTRKPVVLAVGIPLIALVIAGLTGSMVFGAGRDVRVRSRDLLGGRGAVLIVGFVWLIVGVTIGLAFGLRAASTPAPATIATAVGAALFVLSGPALTRKLSRIMLANRRGLAR